MVFPNTYGKIVKLLVGDERGGREARARVLRHRAHARASGRCSTWACSGRRSSSRSSSTSSAGIPPTVESLQLQKQDRAGPRAGERVGGDRHQPRASGACSRRRSCSAATSASGSRTTSTCPTATMAQSNGELVEVAARMVRDVGRRPATVEEAREILGADERAPDAARLRAHQGRRARAAWRRSRCLTRSGATRSARA